MSSVARKISSEFRWVFRVNRIEVSGPDGYPEEAYLDAGAETMDTLGTWVREAM